jgi:hypothetical protein
MPELKNDILPSVQAIAEHVYGKATPKTIRRLRHLIAAHGLPVKKVGGKIESRRSWIDQYYATPDQPASSKEG